MKFTAVASTAALVAAVTADPIGHGWQAPKPGYSRSPCPMLNAIANHGYISRNGKNISLPELQNGFKEGVNFVADILTQVGNIALTISTTGNASTFNLHDLGAHNVIEHDGSLSRKDMYFGDQVPFDQATWKTTVSQMTGPTVPIATAGKIRLNRLAAAQAANPEFTLNDLGTQASVADTALYQIALGDMVNGNPKTKYVKILFEQERIPFNEGYKRKDDPITQEKLDAVIAQVAAVV
ncbi:Chloroperoxidase [Microdochium trichocladiopsis]|uniref:Chloroperoxidase n=1 Tax=Microdochium trichocladiopsis TaxID=1682393 RepID=A0A9P9BKQ9_9PEZI|nr:Chloroperoxidase [Microdochium trichocladiopsis]KAH7021509.1 Chloroperoxidase [Microdochium trichocladiopsis]